MTIVEARSLVKHVICFCGVGVGVRGAVGGDVGADRGEEISAVAGRVELGSEALEVATVCGEGFAMASKVGGFQSGRLRVGVQEAVEGGYCALSLPGVSLRRGRYLAR